MSRPSRLIRWLSGLECRHLHWLLNRVRRHNPSRWIGGDSYFYYNPREVTLMARRTWLALRIEQWQWSPDDSDWFWYDNPLPPWAEWRQCGEEKARNELWDNYVREATDRAMKDWGIFNQPLEPETPEEMAEWDQAVAEARRQGDRWRKHPIWRKG